MKHLIAVYASDAQSKLPCLPLPEPQRLMVDSINIENFKCFERLNLDRLSLINVIVGDNGVGKTALLEAIFMALGEGSELALRFRQHRGMDFSFSGDRSTVEDAFISDYFYNKDISNKVRITLNGKLKDKRQLIIYRDVNTPSPPLSIGITLRIVFEYTNHLGQKFNVGPYSNQGSMQLTGTNEDINMFRFYPAISHVSHMETVTMFSELDRRMLADEFLKVFQAQFPWIKRLSIQVEAGITSIHATVDGVPETLPLLNVSGAIGRLLSVLLSLCRKDGIVVVDEIDNGVYFKKHVSMCKMIIALCRQYNSQIFMTTHSGEWLQALLEAADQDVSDLSLIRMERGEKSPIAKHYSGMTFKDGLEIGGEVR